MCQCANFRFATNIVYESIFFSLTFFERSHVQRLPDREDGLDKDAHAPLWGIDAADDAEAESLLAGALLKVHRQDLHGEGFGTAGDQAALVLLLLLLLK
jgi:hypothetical protein